MHVIHPFDPVVDDQSRILILGSFPSVKSRETGFYYGHPQNRFWKMLGRIFDEGIPVTIADKKDFLKRHHLALWDVLASCEITGSSDASIKKAVPNDLASLLNHSQIKTILINGNTAYTLFVRHIEVDALIQVIRLPSTSAANAVMSLDQLTQRWSIALSEETDTTDSHKSI